MKAKLKNKAFTLVEILATVAVISVLVGLSVFGVKKIKLNANEENAKNTLKLIHTAVQGYASLHNGEYSYDSDPLVAEARLREGTKPLLSRRYCSSATDKTYLSNWYYNCNFTCQHNYYIAAYPESIDYGTKCYAIKKDGSIIEVANISPPACKINLPSCADYEFDDGGSGSGGGSCPLIFTFDGEKYNLVADILSTSSLAHGKVPNLPLPEIDTDEYLKLTGLKALEDNILRLSFVEALDEVSYIDEIELFAVDHLKDIEILPNEYPVIYRPFPEFKIHKIKDVKSLIAAYDGEGNDLLSYLLKKDGQGVPVEKSGLTGFVKAHSIILELGDLSKANKIQLIVNAYFTLPKMEEVKPLLDKDTLVIIYPMVEVPGEDGNWKTIDTGGVVPLTFIGSNYTAKDHIYDLSDVFVNNDYRVRINTSMDIYFDYIGINTFSDDSLIQVNSVEPKASSLKFLGRLKRFKDNIKPFDYNQIDRNCKRKPAKGSYTRFGDVLELVLSADDKYVIMAPGDELRVEFSEKDLPEIPQGYKRTYLLYAKGYHKGTFHDMPLYSDILPLPFHNMSGYPYPESEKYPDDKDHLDYLLKYNTRTID
ncbi:MAG: prepilin-type N-terminal cleavage/methylation domain-containing protein [Candidatus Gygaella obscura]|nr:prepilin-type N-terminal cleavage/methylation domain-containing protein [Candidatus Gygaella obscura]